MCVCVRASLLGTVCVHHVWVQCVCITFGHSVCTSRFDTVCVHHFWAQCVYITFWYSVCITFGHSVCTSRLGTVCIIVCGAGASCKVRAFCYTIVDGHLLHSTREACLHANLCQSLLH